MCSVLNNNLRIMLISIRNDEKIIQEELGIEHICSYLRNKDYNVKLASYFHGNFDFDEVIKYYPHILGFSVYDDSLQQAMKIATAIKSKLDCLIVFGGYAATYHPNEIMESCNSIDIVMKGEGEKCFYKIANAYANNYGYNECKGILYRNNGVIIENKGYECVENLDELPYPARDMLVDYKLTTAYISTSRGCTGKCKFCCSPNFFYKGWRGRSVNNVLEEIKELYYKYSVRRIHFIDSSFEDPDINLSRCESMLDGLLNLNLDIVYSADFRVDFYKKTNEMIMKKMQELAFSHVFLGIEAGNNRDLGIYGKKISIDEIERCIELFQKYDIEIDIGFICFNPYSTIETLRKNIEFLHKYRLDSYMLNIRQLRIYRGTELYEQVKKDNLYLDDYSYNFVDKNIGNLYNFLNTYFSKKKQHDFLMDCQYYSVNYKHYLTKLKFEGQFEMREKLLEQLNLLLYQISEHNYYWFNTLLDLTEKEWDDDVAMDITDKLLNIPLLTQSIKMFNLKHTRIIKKYM